MRQLERNVNTKKKSVNRMKPLKTFRVFDYFIMYVSESEKTALEPYFKITNYVVTKLFRHASVVFLKSKNLKLPLEINAKQYFDIFRILEWNDNVDVNEINEHIKEDIREILRWG